MPAHLGVVSVEKDVFTWHVADTIAQLNKSSIIAVNGIQVVHASRTFYGLSFTIHCENDVAEYIFMTCRSQEYEFISSMVIRIKELLGIG